MAGQANHPLPPETIELAGALNAKVNALVASEVKAWARVIALSASGDTDAPASRRGTPASKRGDADAVAARMSLMGFRERGIRTGLTSDDHITGRVQSAAIPPARMLERIEWKDPELSFPAQAGPLLTRRTYLQVPIVRGGRPETADGTTSFHFEIKSILKASSTAGSGAKSMHSTAQDHAKYIEREEAASRDEDSEAKVTSEGAREAEYIEAGAISSIASEAELTILSNIAESRAERIAFWAKVEKHERTPGEDRIAIDFTRNRALWSAVIADPECPHIFAENARNALAGNAHSSAQKIVSGDNETLRRLLGKHGWRSAFAENANSSPDGETRRTHPGTAEQQIAAQGFAFSDARRGRVQIRMTGELPAEIGHEGRVRILEGLADEFASRDLPFTAVIHAPDANNNRKNFHFHLIAHDQPVKRFTGLASNHIPMLRHDAGPKERAMQETRHAALANEEVLAQIGRWDFEVAYTRKDGKNRTKTSHPFAQRKNRDLNKKTFFKAMRQRMAELTNDELRLSGSSRRVDHRSFMDMGIDKVPDQHLGNARNQGEKLGIPSATGVENERNDWAYRLSVMAQCRAAQLDDLGTFLRSVVTPPRDIARIARDTAYEYELKRLEDRERQRIEDEYRRALLLEAIGRVRSRAMAVIEACQARLDAKKKSRPTKRLRLAIGGRLDEATRHLEFTDGFFSDELAKVKDIDSRLGAHENRNAMLARSVKAIVQNHERAQHEKVMAAKEAAQRAAMRRVEMERNAGHVSRASDRKPVERADRSPAIESGHQISGREGPVRTTQNVAPHATSQPDLVVPGVTRSETPAPVDTAQAPYGTDRVSATNDDRQTSKATVHDQSETERAASPATSIDPRHSPETRAEPTSRTSSMMSGLRHQIQNQRKAEQEEARVRAEANAFGSPQSARSEHPANSLRTDVSQDRAGDKVADEISTPTMQPAAAPVASNGHATDREATGRNVSGPTANTDRHDYSPPQAGATYGAAQSGKRIAEPVAHGTVPKVQETPIGSHAEEPSFLDMMLQKRNEQEQLRRSAYPALGKGLHPLIDIWIEAELSEDERARHTAAEKIMADRDAKRIVGKLYEDDRKRISLDARARRTAEQLDTTPQHVPVAPKQDLGIERDFS